MKASYKMMGVILCGVMLLASGCGAKAETSTASVAESVSESASPVESNPVMFSNQLYDPKGLDLSGSTDRRKRAA